MALILTDEQQELARTVAGFLDKRSSESEVRRLMDDGGGADPAVWAQMAGQLGLQGLIIPEDFGGGGFGFTELVVVLEQMGASLLVAPFLSTVLASAPLLASSNMALKLEYLPGLASGARVGTLALAEATGSWEADSVETTVTNRGTLSGTKHYVVDGRHADFFVVSAQSADGIGLFIVDANSPQVSVSPSKALDATRPLASVEFDSAEARPLAERGERSLLRRALDVAAIALGAEQVGGAQRCLDMAVAYAKVRVQFGRPIGSFQAIKHKCADMLLAVESARSAVYYAAGVLDDGGDEDPAVTSALVQAQCSAAYTHAAAENIQIHGGIGFTWEHPAHLYFKRAKSSEMLFGDPARHRERLAQLVGI